MQETFSAAMFTTIHRGNILIPPGKIGEFANRARKAVQPQLLYRATPLILNIEMHLKIKPCTDFY